MYHYNLLPLEDQKRTKRWIVIKQLTIALCILNAFVLACSLVLWSANRGLHTLIQTTDAQAQQSIALRSVRATPYDIDEINKTIQSIDTIQRDHVNILSLVQAIAAVLPAGITATHISADVATHKITFSGVADTRDALQTLRDQLQQQTVFTIATFPFEALTQQSNIEFQMLLNFSASQFVYE